MNCSTQFVFCTTTFCITLKQHDISLVNLHLRDLCVFGLKVSLAHFFKATFFIKPFFVRHWLDSPTFFPVLIFKHFFAAMINMFSTLSSVVLTSWIGVSSSMYSRMRVWRSAERKISLNFGGESFSQRNCSSRRDSRLFSCEGSSSEILVLMFSQVIIEL